MTTDLYKPGNVLKVNLGALGASECEVFVMVCDVEYLELRNHCFKAMIIKGYNEAPAGRIVNRILKNEVWELSSLSEAGSYSETNRVGLEE